MTSSHAGTSSTDHALDFTRVEPMEPPDSIVNGMLYAVPFLLVGLFMHAYVPSASILGTWLFMLLGVGWILNWLRTSHGRYKYRAAWLELALPLRLGQSMHARLMIPKPVSAGHLQTELSCRRVRWQDTFDETKRDLSASASTLTDDLLWHTEAQFPIVTSDGHSEGRFSLDLPPDQPATDQPAGVDHQGRPGHYWELKIKFTEPGVNFERHFRLSVIRQ